MKYYVIDDKRSKRRQAFVANENKAADCFRSYSGYFTVKIFDDEINAKEFCDFYNDQNNPSYYIEEVELHCCKHGCILSGYDYASWNGLCAYQYITDDDEDDNDDEEYDADDDNYDDYDDYDYYDIYYDKYKKNKRERV